MGVATMAHHVGLELSSVAGAQLVCRYWSTELADKGDLFPSSAFTAANVRMGLAANNVKQHSCFRSKLI
jgi:hypothetical protein